MKKTLLLAAALLCSWNIAAQACDGACPDANVFLDLLRFDGSQNGCNNRFGNDVAMQVARESAEGRIDVNMFKSAFSSTCNADTALTVGRESREGRINGYTFLELQRFDGSQNGCPNRFGVDTALTVAREHARGEIEVQAFRDAFSSICNTDIALTVGREARRGTLSASTFLDMQRFDGSQNGCTNRFGVDISLQIARLAARNRIDVGAFRQAFSATCNTDTALALACAGHAQVSSLYGEQKEAGDALKSGIALSTELPASGRAAAGVSRLD